MLNLNPYVWLAILVALLGLYGAHRWVVHSEVNQAKAEQVVVWEKKVLEAAQKAAKTEDELRLNAVQAKKDKDAEIARINGELAAANQRLLERPKRPQDYSPSAPVGNSCTGRELYQEDGLFLRGEAARAEALIAERDYYFHQYEDARKKLNEQ